MEEIWKDIKGYEGKYQVSNLGNVKSLNYNNTGKERILIPGKQTSGYLCVVLSKNGIHKTFTIHRLIAQTFINNTQNLPEVNHIDEDKTNNRVDNLDWCTAEYNNNFGTRNERSMFTRIVNNGKTAPKKIDQYSLDGKFIKTWNSGTELSKCGFHQGTICQCCKGKLKTSKGYIWKYHE